VSNVWISDYTHSTSLGETSANTLDLCNLQDYTQYKPHVPVHLTYATHSEQCTAQNWE